MLLRDYLLLNSESQAAFAKRADIPPTTVHSIISGGSTTVTTALRIIAASGGAVSLEDLVPHVPEEEPAA